VASTVTDGPSNLETFPNRFSLEELLSPSWQLHFPGGWAPLFDKFIVNPGIPPAGIVVNLGRRQ